MRTVLSLVFLTALLWASCTVKLGAFTLSEHVDRIGETPQAKELLDGTRGRIAPVLEDMKQRLFGEYVEAPTRADGKAAPAAKRQEPRVPRPSPAAVRTEEPGPTERSKQRSQEPGLPARNASRKSVRVEEPAGSGTRAMQSAEPPRSQAVAPARSSGSREPSSAEAARLPGARRKAG
jgi:hypothetical protein